MTHRWFLVVCLAPVGCIPSINTGSNVDRKPMEVAIAAAASLGQTATLAMNAMERPTSCAQATTACSSYPCSGAVTISYGADCPLPLGGVASGSVNVTGTWSSATAATLSSTFVNVQAGGKNNVVTSATNLTATPSSVSYTGQNAVVRGGGTLAAQSTWNVSVDNMGRYTISGTQQAGSGGGSAQQLDVTNVILDPSCTLNPVGGEAVIQDVSGLNVSAATITFHSACDGKAQADGSSVGVQFVGL
jgi:hypothetical protein